MRTILIGAALVMVLAGASAQTMPSSDSGVKPTPVSIIFTPPSPPPRTCVPGAEPSCPMVPCPPQPAPGTSPGPCPPKTAQYD